jgi:hypothetical protein
MTIRVMAFALAVGLTGCAESYDNGAGSQLVTGAIGSVGANRKAVELTQCVQPLGTVAIEEKDIPGLASKGLTSPAPLVRLMLAQSGCFIVLDRGAVVARIEEEQAAARKKRPAKQPRQVTPVTPLYYLTPDIVIPDGNELASGAGGPLPGWAKAIVGSPGVEMSEAQTALYLTDARTGVQVAAVTGTAPVTVFGFALAALGPDATGLGNAYAGTTIGKTVAASFFDAYGKLVNQLLPASPPG